MPMTFKQTDRQLGLNILYTHALINPDHVINSVNENPLTANISLVTTRRCRCFNEISTCYCSCRLQAMHGEMGFHPTNTTRHVTSPPTAQQRPCPNCGCSGGVASQRQMNYVTSRAVVSTAGNKGIYCLVLANNRTVISYQL